MNRIFLAVIIWLLSYSASAGPIIQVDDNLYEINTVTGHLSSHRSIIENQVWFGDRELARLFANELGTQLSLPNFGQLGPAFGFSIYDGAGADYTVSWLYKPSNTHLDIDNRAQVQNATAGGYYTYAIAEQVDAVDVLEPNTFMLFLMAWIFMYIGHSLKTSEGRNLSTGDHK